MAKKLPHIVVIGPRADFSRAFDRLEATGKYRLTYVADLGTARPFLRETPDAILLRLPAEERACDQTLAWVESMKERTSVVVISSQEGMHYYLAAMEHGAFDYCTCRTPFEEIVRVLDNATVWHTHQAA